MSWIRGLKQHSRVRVLLSNYVLCFTAPTHPASTKLGSDRIRSWIRSWITDGVIRIAPRIEKEKFKHIYLKTLELCCAVCMLLFDTVWWTMLSYFYCYSIALYSDWNKTYSAWNSNCQEAGQSAIYTAQLGSSTWGDWEQIQWMAG